MYKFCLVICFSVIVLCYVGARDYVSQCVGHVLCGSSLWSCESVCWSYVIWVVSVVM